MLEVGDRAPDFLLEAVHGGLVSLVELTRSAPALVVFVSEECPTSRMTLERLEALREPFAAAGATLVAIHEDAADVAAETMRRCGATYLALVEPAPFGTAEAYGVRTVPTTFLIDENALVQAAVEGWNRAELQALAERVASRKPSGPAPLLTAEPPAMKPGCGSKNTLDVATVAAMESSSFDEIEDLFERGWTDGLPVVPPTRERVRRMLAGRDAARSLGPVPPGMGELTLERLASCAVLAGCKPEYFPIVIAAAEATLDPAFNIHGMTNTTHTCGPVVIVNGPVCDRVGMNSGINAMGGWNRANATIGRSIRLMVGLTGNGAPPGLDRSTLGQPGKISFCFAENEQASPWEPLAVTRGFEPGDSVVTLYCGDAPFSVSDHYSRDPEDILFTIATAGAAAFSPTVFPIAAETVFVIGPEHSRSLAGAGWSKRDVAERIVEVTKRQVKDMKRGERGPFVAGLPDDTWLPKWMSADEVVIVVTGGHAGRFSAILPPWVGYGLGSKMVSKRIQEDL